MFQFMDIVRSLFLFVLAGLCEIGGGYLMWLWLRDDKGILFALLGALTLIVYGIIPTFQSSNFGRVYAAYGGIFIVLSIIWGWQIDKIGPDRLSYRRPHSSDRCCGHHVLAERIESPLLP
jgi:small multidrug resistance family-3 protein